MRAWSETQPPMTIKRLFNYGDSLTDQNNTYFYTGFLLNKYSHPKQSLKLYPWARYFVPDFLLQWTLTHLPRKPYVQGRFSDGKTFMEILAGFAGVLDDSGETFINLAHGGSATVTNTAFLHSLILLSNQPWGVIRVPQQLYSYIMAGQFLFPALYHQVQFSINKHSPFSSQDVFVVASGANDNMFRIWKPELVSSTQEQAIQSLYQAGARIIFWESIPDYTLAPCLRQASDVSSLKASVQRQNRYIRKSIIELRKAYPDLRLIFIDTARIFELLLDEAFRQGMNTETPCTKIVFKGCSIEGGIDMLDLDSQAEIPVCANSNQYFFFDAAHLGQRANRWVAELVCRMLKEQHFDVSCPTTVDFDIDGVMRRYHSPAKNTGGN